MGGSRQSFRPLMSVAVASYRSDRLKCTRRVTIIISTCISKRFWFSDKEEEEAVSQSIWYDCFWNCRLLANAENSEKQADVLLCDVLESGQGLCEMR